MGFEACAVEDMVGNSFARRRVLLTGHTGFKGSWLALTLVRLGAVVRGYALDPATEPSMYVSARIGSLIEDVRGDVRDFSKLDRAMREFAPEVVFHLAAQAMVRQSYADPVGTYATNVLGTAHVLESIRRLPSVQAVVVVTSDKCYRNEEWRWGYRETDALGGHDPYSSSKACVELLTASFRDSFFASNETGGPYACIATARAGNVIGGGDWSEDRLIPDLIRGFIDRQQVLIRYPLAIRPWQHVLGPISGYLLLAERLLRGDRNAAGAWNFGPGDQDAWPVGRVASRVATLWGGCAGWIRGREESPHEAGLLKLDSSKARDELGWRPDLGLEMSLAWVVDWYRACQEGADMQAFSLDQVSMFEERGSPQESSIAAAAVSRTSFQ